MDKILARNNPFFKNLDLILGKQNQASIQLALLKHEQKQLSSENDDLKVIMREVFHNLATSSDLGMRSVADHLFSNIRRYNDDIYFSAGDGLLSTQKKHMSKQKRKKRRPKPISYQGAGQGMLLSKTVMMKADIRPFSKASSPLPPEAPGRL